MSKEDNDSLYRRPKMQGRHRLDELRHEEKVNEAIKQQLPKLLSDGDVLFTDPNTKRTVKIEKKLLDIPTFRHKKSEDSPQMRGVKGMKPGDEEGEFYEVEKTNEELVDMMWEEVGLPNLSPKHLGTPTETDYVFDSYSTHETPERLSFIRTAIENMKRNAQEHGEAKMDDFQPEDYRVKNFSEEPIHQYMATICVIGDFSGSRTDEQKSIEILMCLYLQRMCEEKYENINWMFIGHTTTAREYKAHSYFTMRGTGGTKCSSAQEYVRDIGLTRYPTDTHDVYVLYSSDGYNDGDDDPHCLDVINELLARGIAWYGYVQTGPEGQLYPMLASTIRDDRFAATMLRDKSEVRQAFIDLFRIKL